MIDTTGSHPRTVHVARSFRTEHLADDKERSAAGERQTFVGARFDALPDGPEPTAGSLRRLPGVPRSTRAARLTLQV